MFSLTSAPIDPAPLLAELRQPGAGAVVIFEGRVRDHHLGRPVTRLEYEAFDEMALAEGEAIVREAERLHPGARVACVHRTGSLGLGELAVWIGVASARRQAGFAACRFVIEELKRRLPVWKKEHHPDGASEWVNCTTEAAPPSAARHARQVSLPEIGAAGQARIAGARVLIVGLGGLGCPAALYLAGAGVGRLTLVDGGEVDLPDLPRQVLYTTAEVGAPKALAAAARLRLHNPEIVIDPREAELAVGNVRALVAGHDVVLDCTDNFTTRFLVHDACHALDIPLVSAAVHRFEGTLEVFRRGEGGCLHCQWAGRTAAELETAGRCADAAVFGPAVGLLGVMQAAETLKLLVGMAGAAARETRLVSLLDGRVDTVARPPRPGCALCGGLETLRSGPAVGGDDSPIWLTAARAAALTPPGRVVHLLEPGDAPPAAPALAVPAQDLVRLRELAANGPVVLTCRRGLRSAALARLLRAEGAGGVFALAIGEPVPDGALDA